MIYQIPLLILACLLVTLVAEAKKNPLSQQPPVLRARDIVPCNDKNLLLRSSVKLMGEGSGLLGNLTDGKVYENGALWNLPQNVTLTRGSFLLFDLGLEHPISSAWMQGDNNDVYTVEGSLDGTTYVPIALFPPVAALGLQTRSLTNFKANARYIKITPSEGDGWYSLSEAGLYCETPSPFPPQTQILATQKETPWGNRINDYRVTVYKVFIVLAALLLFGVSYYLKRSGRTKYLISSRSLLLGLVALMAYSSYYNFYHWHFENNIHSWEVYHYYLGSKYFPELGYVKLYECTSLADSEEGLLSQVQNRKIRDHRSNTIRPATYILENPSLCKEKFTPRRWEEFKTDLRWFRGAMDSNRWSSMQMDHGYNPPPVWTTLGRLVGSFYKPTIDNIRSLVQLDILIVLIGFAFIGWAFGWEALLLAVIIWGTNYPSRYYWIGGAFLRQSWLVASMIGLSFLKKQKPVWGSIFLSLATAITIFPLMFVVGIGLKIFQDWRQTKMLTPFYRRFLAGTIISGALLFSLSLAGTGGGFSAYRDFTHIMQTHMNTPLTNNMGLKTVMNFRPSTMGEKMYDNRRLDPFEVWKQERRQAFQSIKPLYWVVISGFFFLFWRAIRGAEPWEAAALGFTLIPMLNELTCYYYSFIIGGSLIGSQRPKLGLIMLLANLAWLMCEFYFGWFDVKYTYASLVGILLCFYFVFEMGKTKSNHS